MISRLPKSPERARVKAVQVAAVNVDPAVAAQVVGPAAVVPPAVDKAVPAAVVLPVVGPAAAAA